MNMTGQKLKELRELHGVSQTEVADFLGYTVKGKPNRSMISRFENEYSPINGRISMLLDVYFSTVINR